MATPPRTETGLRGTLVIAGGAMSENSGQVIEALLAHRLPGPVGVIGAASSTPDASARRAAASINEIAAGQVAIVLPFRADQPDLANDPRAVAMIEACGGLWFTGGSQSRILEALRPSSSEADADENTDSAAWHACNELLARGGVIGGTSAGAAMMSDPMIRRGRSADALAHGVGSEGVELGQGMGFFPWGICGQHFLERGRFGRMVVALEETGRRFGWGVSEDSALIVDRATGWVEVIGPSGLALFDAESLKTSAARWDGVVLALLGTGDRVHAPTGMIEPAPQAASLDPGDGAGQELVIEGLWGPDALRDACLHLAQGGGRSRITTSILEASVLTGGMACALLRDEGEARAWRVQDDSSVERWSVQGIRLDIYRMTY
jgi:cyanophycinase